MVPRLQQRVQQPVRVLAHGRLARHALAIGRQPHRRLAVLVGARLDQDNLDSTIPFENSAAFEAVLAEAGCDVELVQHEAGHSVPGDLVFDAVMELVE